MSSPLFADIWPHLWIPLTLMAAVVQAIRTGFQKHMTRYLNVSAITMSRYVFGVPFALTYLVIIIALHPEPLPPLTGEFLLYSLAAGITQILGTAFMVATFYRRNFSVGIACSRTEGLQAAILGTLIFSTPISLEGWTAITVCAVGVLGLAVRGNDKLPETPHFWLRRFFHRSTGFGLLAGLFFAFGISFIREASLSLPSGSFLLRSAFCLAVVVPLQAVLLGSWMFIYHRPHLQSLRRHWGAGWMVGLTSVIGSIGWFTASTIQNPAYVKTLGQVEIIIALLMGRYIFREHVHRRELLSTITVSAGIVLLLLRG